MKLHKDGTLEDTVQEIADKQNHDKVNKLKDAADRTKVAFFAKLLDELFD